VTAGQETTLRDAVNALVDAARRRADAAAALSAAKQRYDACSVDESVARDQYLAVLKEMRDA
jgi:hypothetical protein